MSATSHVSLLSRWSYRRFCVPAFVGARASTRANRSCPRLAERCIRCSTECLVLEEVTDRAIRFAWRASGWPGEWRDGEIAHVGHPADGGLPGADGHERTCGGSGDHGAWEKSSSAGPSLTTTMMTRLGLALLSSSLDDSISSPNCTAFISGTFEDRVGYMPPHSPLLGRVRLSLMTMSVTTGPRHRVTSGCPDELQIVFQSSVFSASRVSSLQRRLYLCPLDEAAMPSHCGDDLEVDCS